VTSRQDTKGRVRSGLRAWFRTPPRRHGEVVYTREVSFLELFYDLVYVVLIAQVSHHLEWDLRAGDSADAIGAKQAHAETDL